MAYKVGKPVPLWQKSTWQTTDPERTLGYARMPREDLVKCLKTQAARSGPHVCFPLKGNTANGGLYIP